MAKSKDTITAYDDSKWRAESDCHTLIEAEKIRNDPARLKAARAAAKRKAEELKETMDAMSAMGKK